MVWVILCGLFSGWILFLLTELLFLGSTCRDILRSVIITLILMGLVLYFADSYWEKTRWISTDAVVVKQKAISEKNFNDDWEIAYYETTYEVVHKGKTYQIERNFVQSIEAGESVTIRINPKDPSDDMTLPTKMWIYSLLLSVCVFLLKWLIDRTAVRKKDKRDVRQFARTAMEEKNRNALS